MTKLDWTKAGVRSSDPGRVVDVGDCGILPDRLAGRKGDLKVRKEKAKKKASKAAGLAGSPKPHPALPAKAQKPAKGAGVAKKKPQSGKPQGGLTIPELIARAKEKVDRLAAEIEREERKLKNLREQLKSAEHQLQIAQDTPRRSSVGRALHDAQRRAETASAPHPKV